MEGKKIIFSGLTHFDVYEFNWAQKSKLDSEQISKRTQALIDYAESGKLVHFGRASASHSFPHSYLLTGKVNNIGRASLDVENMSRRGTKYLRRFYRKAVGVVDDEMVRYISLQEAVYKIISFSDIRVVGDRVSCDFPSRNFEYFQEEIDDRIFTVCWINN
jgi:hypothetical protein